MDRKYIKLAIRIFITSALLVWVFSRVDRQQFLQAIPKARIEYLVLLWGISVAFLALRAAKMQYILKQQSLDMGRFDAAFVCCIHYEHYIMHQRDRWIGGSAD